MKCFTNLHAGDIRLDENSRGGLRAFREFLAYAEGGEIDDLRSSSGVGAASLFQQEVSERLRASGYACDESADASGFFVDIAVSHPDRPGAICAGHRVRRRLVQ